MLIELTLAGEFENQEDALAVVEVTEKTENVGVGKIRLNLDLSADLFLDLSLLELDLVEYLERADEATRAFPRQVDSSELAFTERLSNLKHAEVELSRRRGLLRDGG